MNTSINHFDFIFIYIFIFETNEIGGREAERGTKIHRRLFQIKMYHSVLTVSRSSGQKLCRILAYSMRQRITISAMSAHRNLFACVCVCRVSTVDSTNLHIKLTMTTANMHIIILANLLFYFAQFLCVCVSLFVCCRMRYGKNKVNIWRRRWRRWWLRRWRQRRQTC